MIDPATIEAARSTPIGIETSARHIKLRAVGVRGEFVGPCPRCGGTDRFSINTVENVWNCRRCRGNSTGDVIGLVMHLDGCSFEQAVSKITGKQSEKPNGAASSDVLGPIVAEYHYVDEAGTILFRVTKHDPKDFRQSRPDGRGGWIPGIGDVRRVLYRLPDLIEAVERKQRIWLVEGEKDVDRLWSLGYPATCNPHGAGRWRSEYDHFLAGAELVVIADNDDPGRKHAEDLVSRLGNIAASVRLVDIGKVWPDCPDKGDISDYLDAGLRIDDLVNNHRIKPESYIWTRPEDIPVREWLYGHYLIRKFVSVDVAKPGLGKTSHAIVEAISMLTGKPLLGITPAKKLNVWMLNLEDPRVEFDRRFQAACKYYGINKEEIEGRFFVTHGRETPICIANTSRDGTMINEPDVDAIIYGGTRNNIDVIHADPFVSSHSVTENDNNAIDYVLKKWGFISEQVNCAMRLTHHTRKGDLETTVDSARGGSAIIGASRVVRVFNGMSKEEAEKIAIKDDGKRRRYYRVDIDKQNMAPPAESSSWYELVSVCLFNGDPGDYVGVSVPWMYPKPLDGISGKDFDLVAAVIRSGRWRENVRSKDWIGFAVAKTLRMDATNVADRAKINGMIKAWIASGALLVVDGYGDDRHPCRWVEVNEQQ